MAVKYDKSLFDRLINGLGQGQVVSFRQLREIYGDDYSPNYLSTVLSSFAEETGDSVRQGRQPRFRRVSPGRYEIL